MTSRLMKSLAAFLLLTGVMALPASADTLQAFITTPTTIASGALSFTGAGPGGLIVNQSSGVGFDPTLISVTPNTNSDGAGLEFNGAFGPVTSGQTLDVNFKYSVTAPTGTNIDDLSMTILSGAVSGTGKISITETVFSDPGHTHEIGTPFTYVYSSANKYYDIVFPTNTYSTVYVVKDITLTGGSWGTAAMSDFSQNFSTTTVPEPATVALACGGLPVLGLFWARRRRAI